jgi:hypothetical protein
VVIIQIIFLKIHGFIKIQILVKIPRLRHPPDTLHYRDKLFQKGDLLLESCACFEKLFFATKTLKLKIPQKGITLIILILWVLLVL